MPYFIPFIVAQYCNLWYVQFIPDHKVGHKIATDWKQIEVG